MDGLNKSLLSLGLDTKSVTSTLGRTSQCELSRGKSGRSEGIMEF